MSAGKMTVEQVARKRAREWGTICCASARRMQAANDDCHGEAFLALVCESSFMAGAAFAMRRMAKELDDENVVHALGKEPFPYGIAPWEDRQ